MVQTSVSASLDAKNLISLLSSRAKNEKDSSQLLSIKTLQKADKSTFRPSGINNNKEAQQNERKPSSCPSTKCSNCNKTRKSQTNHLSSQGLVAQQTGSFRTQTVTSPFQFVHLLAQHVQGHVTASCHLCHLPVVFLNFLQSSEPLAPD